MKRVSDIFWCNMKIVLKQKKIVLGSNIKFLYLYINCSNYKNEKLVFMIFEVILICLRSFYNIKEDTMINVVLYFW